VLLELVGVVFGGGEGEAGCDDTFDAVPSQSWPRKLVNYSRRVVGQVQEQRDTLHAAVLLKVSCEEAARLQVDTHGTEDNGEVVLVAVVHALVGCANQTGLSANLGGDFVVRQTGRGEDGDLLAAGNRVHRVDGRDTSRDHLFGVHLWAVSGQPSLSGRASYT
jgi:hypothetical protein